MKRSAVLIAAAWTIVASAATVAKAAPEQAPDVLTRIRQVREQDLKQNAIVMAWFAWQAATTAERIPRP